jgi:hypothetical protein
MMPENKTLGRKTQEKEGVQERLTGTGVLAANK